MFTYNESDVLASLKTAIRAQAVVFDRAQRGLDGGDLVKTAEPLTWLAHLPDAERPDFYNWLWAISKPTEDETVIPPKAGYALRVILGRRLAEMNEAEAVFNEMTRRAMVEDKARAAAH